MEDVRVAWKKNGWEALMYAEIHQAHIFNLRLPTPFLNFYVLCLNTHECSPLKLFLLLFPNVSILRFRLTVRSAHITFA